MTALRPAQFARQIAELAEGRPRVLVGIAGAPGAGKSTLAAATAAALAPDAVVLPMDGFHLPQARLVALGRRERMGAPDTFDLDAFVAVLRALRANPVAEEPAQLTTPAAEEPAQRASRSPVFAPLFDRTTEEPVADALEVTPDIRIVLVEGNYLLHDRDGWERVAPLLDLTAYVDEDDELRRERLIARHIEFGKTPDAARAWVLGPDEANARLIAATASRAGLRVRVE
jgi:pantothenate kinase